MKIQLSLFKKVAPRAGGRHASAQGMVEFALAIPIFLLLVFGVVEFARWLWFYSLSYTASREAARYGASVGLVGSTPRERDCVGIADEAVRVGRYAGITAADVDIRYDIGPDDGRAWNSLPTCAADPTTVLGDRILVRVTVPFQPMFGIVPETDIVNTAARTIIKNVDVGGTPGPLLPSPTPRNTRTPTPTPTLTETPIPVDFKPYVVSTIPLSDEIDVLVSTDLTVTFSEAVTAADVWAVLTCDGAAVNVVLSGSDTTYIINPVDPLPYGKPCTATVFAANITDLDDTIDAMEADYTWNFTTKPDFPPTVISVTPMNGSINVSVFSPLTVRFSEPVTADGTWATLTCDALPVPVTFSGSGDYYSVTPGSPLVPGKVCTATVFASKITDLDGIINPMETDYTWSFTTKPDFPPTVISTTPAADAVDVPVNTLLTVTFSEPVTAAGTWATLSCGSTSYALTFSGSGATYTITPASNLQAGTVCTATVVAANISDLDGAVTLMAANYSWTFTLIPDEAPWVVSTSPYNYESNVDLASNLTVTFSEPVDIASGAYSITCGLSGTHTAVISGGPTTFTINPNTEFYYGEQCVVTLENTLITDQDLFDPLDAMAADYVWHFYTPYVDWCSKITRTPPSFADAPKYKINLQNNFSLPARIVQLHVTWDFKKLQTVTLGTTVWDDTSSSFDLTITTWDTTPVLAPVGTIGNNKDLVILFEHQNAVPIDTDMIIEFGNNPNYRCSINPPVVN